MYYVYLRRNLCLSNLSLLSFSEIIYLTSLYTLNLFIIYFMQNLDIIQKKVKQDSGYIVEKTEENMYDFQDIDEDILE